MSPADGATSYTLRNVQELLGLSRTVVTRLIREGFVVPLPGRHNEYRFTLRDLMLLRTAYGLQQANIPPRRIVRALDSLRGSLPPELPLTGLRITAIGDQVVVRDERGHWQADTGQFLMDFDVTARHGKVILMEHTGADAGSERSTERAEEWFQRGEAQEPASLQEAEQSYRRAIEVDPMFLPPYVNLGALLSAASRSAEASALYEQALTLGLNDATLHFNHGVSLEEQGRDDDAIASYELALKLDPDLVDAHYNASRLLEQHGDAQGALRHLSALRRLGA